jgi:hypothetical protein
MKHTFEEIEYDTIHDAVHDYTIVIADTLRLTRMELYELDPRLSDEMDTAALSEARADYNDRLADRCSLKQNP